MLQNTSNCTQELHCSTLQQHCNTNHCNMLEHTAKHLSTTHRIEITRELHCNTLHHATAQLTATHCNTLQHSAIHFAATHQHARQIALTNTQEQHHNTQTVTNTHSTHTHPRYTRAKGKDNTSQMRDIITRTYKLLQMMTKQNFTRSN